MLNIFFVEVKKLFSSKILWLIVSGALLPGGITLLTMMDNKSVELKDYLHFSMINFNSQSLLVFSCFASYLWAREYEERTMEVTLCYPHKEYMFFLSKLILTLILSTVVLYFGNSIFGAYINGTISDIDALLVKFIRVLGLIVIMHFMLASFTFWITMITKNVISGVVTGVMLVVICNIFQTTDFIQYIPFCIPMVLSDHFFGFEMFKLSSYITSWSILSITFIVPFILCMIFLRKKWRLI